MCVVRIMWRCGARARGPRRAAPAAPREGLYYPLTRGRARAYICIPHRLADRPRIGQRGPYQVCSTETIAIFGLSHIIHQF